MPPLPGFSDNQFESRDDFIEAIIALVDPLKKYFSPGKSAIKIPVATGAHFDDSAAQLEGYARCLWGIAPLIYGYESIDNKELASRVDELVQPWVDGLIAGTDPEHLEYWGSIKDMSQQMVEAEMIAFTLIAAPKRFYDPLNDRQKTNVKSWLNSINGKEMPPTNWRWFRVFCNLALIKTCGVSPSQLQGDMDADLQLLDSFYITEGWSGDGPWQTPEQADEERSVAVSTGRHDSIGVGRQADYYSGSFAIQFSQLLYSKFAADIDEERCKMYQQRARDFGSDIWRYFDSEGSAIPFGRSLTYRFACGAFFGALAFAKVPNMPKPLDSPGAIKGFLTRHMRWWAQNSSEIFATDGTLTIGWLYPNMYMCEDYNSPQSPNWSLKTLIAVGLAYDDEFWNSEPLPYPQFNPPCQLVRAPQQIVCNHPLGNHHFMLTPGQFVAWPMKANQAKYCKFAYSSAFGFSVPTGTLIKQIAPDSQLALSRDGGEVWAVKWKCGVVKFGTISSTTDRNIAETVQFAKVTWFPWNDRHVTVDTVLIPPTEQWPDWHVRAHRIRCNNTIHSLFTVEGGFAILDQNASFAIPDDATSDMSGKDLSHENSTVISSADGTSGVVIDAFLDGSRTAAEAYPLKPDSNTNLVRQKTLIPVATISIPQALEPGTELLIITSVFAVSSKVNGGVPRTGLSLKQRWLNRPSIGMESIHQALSDS
ncbi:hypothetical protein NW768_001714 [Fusarium equiseti]|uniref:DUF2264 domain-containing protein n=1 Tax=Fusarium equiseti TaxID=61235 RepID=A0ABQ8RR07_FUSEQ|nr:hypothetical protein NW768_001714 [Fusarium equiseti]